jgi:hypothetical protein
MVISARRGKPGAQTAALNYATPAAGIDSTKVPEGTHRAGAGDTATGASAAQADIADDWLRRAREFEAAGRRKEALQAYREAASALRGAAPRSPERSPAPAPTPVYSTIDP